MIAFYKSKIGNIIVIFNNNSIIKVVLNKNKINNILNIIEYSGLSIAKDIKNWFDDYFNDKKPSINNLSIELNGSDFQKKVWQLLCNIPYGETTTYKNIAKQISITMSAQAVGTAISKNPIPIIIPCHRVINTNNNIGNYHYGVNNKIKLLKHENVDMSKIITKLF